MEDLNFIINNDKTPPPAYADFDSAAAFAFFSSAGKEQEVAAGEIIFEEHQKSSRFLMRRDKMYLLLEGSVELTAQGEPFGMVQQGEIFGEMSSITQTPRTATATATTACRLISLDDKQFLSSLREHPEFALTLMVLMTRRLRKMISELSNSNTLSEDSEANESSPFDEDFLAELVNELGDNACMHYEHGKVIMHEGRAGVFMYVVLEGSVEISIQGVVVEKVGAGGFFGEMALIERSERLASAVAETDCTLLAINRNAFINLVKEQPEFAVAILTDIGERARYMITHHARITK